MKGAVGRRRRTIGEAAGRSYCYSGKPTSVG